MKLISQNIIISLALFLVCNASFAEGPIDLTEISAKVWDCSSSDQYFTGVIRFYFKEVNGKKIKGETTWCFPQRGKNSILKGKLKKDTLKFSVSVEGAAADCPNISGKMKFTRDTNGKLTAKGGYSSQYQRGKMDCKVSEFQQ
ncbi:MAG: hypothetical protein AAF304_09555 [Pseudomonadota bacterium]